MLQGIEPEAIGVRLALLALCHSSYRIVEMPLKINDFSFLVMCKEHIRIYAEAGNLVLIPKHMWPVEQLV